jgi:hypothetical protein
MQRLLVQDQSDGAERTATLLGTKVDMLRDALKATARQARAEFWTDSEAMRQHTAANAALGSLFENVLAARPSGELLGRLAMGKLSGGASEPRGSDLFSAGADTSINSPDLALGPVCACRTGRLGVPTGLGTMIPRSLWRRRAAHAGRPGGRLTQVSPSVGQGPRRNRLSAVLASLIEVAS